MGKGLRSGLVILPLLALATGLLVFNCRGDDSSKEKGPGGSADATALQGKWTTGCIPDPSKAGYYLIDTRHFDGKQFSTGFETFSDASCKTRVLTHAQNGSFEIDSPEGGDEAGAIHNLDIVVGAIFITLHVPSLVESYNAKMICGGGWKQGEKRQLLREECDPDGAVGADPDEADRIYDIFSFEDGALKFGDKSEPATNGKAPDRRPTAIDPAKTFKAE